MTVLCGLLVVVQAAAQDPVALASADALVLKGNYREAYEQYAAAKDGDPIVLALGKSRCLRAEGKYTEAAGELEAGLKAKPGNANLLAAKADLSLLHGKIADAEKTANKAIEIDDKNLLARWVRAQTMTAAGKAEQANAEFKWFVDYYNQAQPTDPEKLFLIARGAVEYAVRNRLHDELDFVLNEMLADAVKADPDFWPAKWLSGELLVEKYNKTQGVPDLQAALKINPNAVEVLASLADSSLQDYDFDAAGNFADRALAINAHSQEALWVKADVCLADSRTAQAIPFLERCKAVNPVSEETLGRLASCYLLQHEPEKAAQIEKEVLARNPRPGVFYGLLGDQLERRRQFDVAEGYYLKAIKASPYLAGPLNGLGMLYMRVGKEDEARKIFTEAQAIDPFHVRVKNMSKVLKHIENYKVIRSPHYEFYVTPGPDEMLGKYMSQYMESVHPTLCKRFGFEPPQRTKIEIMKDHQWFSGRVVGVPSIGTVGACTGKVVALTSPTSMRGGKFNWARVLTHEVTHIITLQQTNFNIPHWYTEALAVLSEGYPRPEVWNDLLAERVPAGDLFNLDDINHAFVRPKTPLDWQMAYCQSLLYAQYMLERFGENALARLLDAYRGGLETDAALRRAFAVDKVDFERGYRKYLDKLVKGLKTWSTTKPLSFAEAERAYRAKPKDADLAAALAVHHLQRKNPVRARELAEEALKLRQNHPLALYVLAKMELSIGKLDDAVRILKPGVDAAKPDQQALELLASLYMRQKKYPDAIGLYEQAHRLDPLRGKWLEGVVLAELKQGEEGVKVDEKRLREALENLSQIDADNLKVRKRLAEMDSKAARWSEAANWARQIMYIDVNDLEAHRLLAEATYSLKQYTQAADEYELLMARDPKAKALAVKAAECYLGADNPTKARQLLRTYIRENPDDAKAKQLLGEALRK